MMPGMMSGMMPGMMTGAMPGMMTGAGNMMAIPGMVPSMMPGAGFPGGTMMPGMMPSGTMLPTGGGLMPNVGLANGSASLLSGLMPNGLLPNTPSSAGLLGTTAPGLPLPTAAMPLAPGLLPAGSPSQPPPPPHPPSHEALAGWQKQLSADVEAAVAEPEQESLEALKLDAEVKKLCVHFEIEPECAKRLDEEMSKRQDSKESDLARLYDILDDVGSPTCLLEIKISEMASGEFVGKVLEDREAKAVALNCGLNAQATQKLCELVSRRATKKGEDLVRMEFLMEYAKEPSSTAISFASRLLAKEIEALPDLSEAQDVIKKFDLDSEAKDKLIEIVLARPDDSSALLGGLEVYFEKVRSPSSALLALAGRLLAGGDVPDPQDHREDRKPVDRDRGRDRDRSRERDRKKKSRSRSRRRSPSVKRRSRSRDRRK